MQEIFEVTRSCGISSRKVCVDVIVQPSGRLINNGFYVGCSLIIGALGRRKCLVVPESNKP